MAEPTPLERYVTWTVQRTQDSDALLTPDQYADAVRAALAMYSKHRPRTLVEDLAGDGDYDYDLPDDWVEGSSSLKTVEHPAGQREPIVLEAEDYTLYQTADATVLRFLQLIPVAGETIRLTFTAPHVIDDTTTTVPVNDANAVADLAASVACEWLSSRFSQSGEPTLQADSADHTSKARDFALRATAFRNQYYDYMGLPRPGAKTSDGREASSASVAAASAVRDWDTDLSTGDDRLTHPRRRR